MTALSLPLQAGAIAQFLLFAIPLYCIGWVWYTRYLHPLRYVPGPFWASVSRYWLVSTTLQGKMEHVQRALHVKYGPLIRIGPDELACADPEAIKTIYPTQNPLSKTDFYPLWGGSAGFSKYPDNFSGTDEKLHTQRRRIVNGIYSLSNVLQCEEEIDKCSALFIEKLGQIADTEGLLNLGEWLHWYAFDVIGALFFGKMFGFMEKSYDHAAYIYSLDTLFPVLLRAAVAPNYWRPFILGTSMISSRVREAMKALENIQNAARDSVDARLAEGYDARSKHDLLQQLLGIVDEKGLKLDFGHGEVRLESYVAFAAGSDTTAVALRAIFYYLLQNPESYQKVQNEIDAAVEKGGLSNNVQYAEASNLRFMCACIKEAMRLHPSVGLTLPRHSPPGGMEIAGTYIPEGYRVGMNAAVVHYDKSIFGEDADKFRPSRWLEADAPNMDKHLLTFGAGTRTCIGKNISLSEIHKIVPQVLRNFHLELAPDARWTTVNWWFIRQYGLKVRISRR